VRQPDPHQAAFLFESQALGDRQCVEVAVPKWLSAAVRRRSPRAQRSRFLFAEYHQRQQFFTVAVVKTVVNWKVVGMSIGDAEGGIRC